jgi:hypothetical protein
MQATQERILESIQQICDLYHNNIDVDKAAKLMRSQDISAELVKAIYDQLSTKDEKLMMDRFYYYTIEPDFDDNFKNCWTSRYLITGYSKSLDPDFHDITVFDAFNDKSM